MSTETRHLTDAQRDAARNGYDPDHTLDDAELAETALGGLRFAAAELRHIADQESCGMAAYLRDGWSETKQAAAQERVDFADRLRQRADELDPPT